jgi:hypothetical protein
VSGRERPGREQIDLQALAQIRRARDLLRETRQALRQVRVVAVLRARRLALGVHIVLLRVCRGRCSRTRADARWL